MRLLVVDDEYALREPLAENLRGQRFAVDTACDGTEGSYLARTNPYDLVILDNMLPEKSGTSVCTDIRSTGHTMPILVLSALTDTWRKAELLNAGADDYLAKPFSFDELMARIRALLRRPHGIVGDILALDTLMLDTRRQVAMRDGRRLPLTRKEFMLLTYLMRNAGAVVTRGMILDHVWDMLSDPFSNTIESHIRGLRKKLGATGGTPLIHTVPGCGYKIDVEE